MFDLEDFDLDDEVFLNTQMPTVVGVSPKKSSNSNRVSLNFEDDDELFLNVSNSDFESSLSQNNDLQTKSSKENNKNKSNLCNNKNVVSTRVQQSEIDVSRSKNKLNFDDCFDSDDEAIFNTIDVLFEPVKNSIKTDDRVAKINENNNHNNKRVLDFNYESHKSTPTIVKNTNKSNHNSLLNTTVTSVKSITPKCASRKFPGPAGLLSENEDLCSEDPLHLESLDMSMNISEVDKKEENLCTQANDSSFSSSPYQQFLTDFFTTDIDTMLNKYNVAWIKQKLLPYTASGRFFTDKIPFFVSVIKEIDCLSPDPAVLLADKTGHIRGTIHRAVWNQFSSQLKTGAVLVLSKVGVSCQKIAKSFTLNITSDHLIAIYSLSSEDQQEVIVTRATELRNEEIVNNAKQWNSLNVEAFHNNSPHSEISSRMTDNSKPRNVLSDQNSPPPSNANSRTADESSVCSTPVYSSFRLKTPVAQKLFDRNYSCSDSFSEEPPPSKRIRSEECESSHNASNEMSIIQNVFEGIDEDEMFNDFCC